MQFLVTIDVAPADGSLVEITEEQMREHIETYVFAPNTSYEMSLVPDDPYHELESSNYVLFEVLSARVELT